MHLDFNVKTWLNWQKLSLLLATALVLAAIPGTSAAGFWFAVVLGLMLVVSLMGGKKLTWE